MHDLTWYDTECNECNCNLGGAAIRELQKYTGNITYTCTQAYMLMKPHNKRWKPTFLKEILSTISWTDFHVGHFLCMPRRNADNFRNCDRGVHNCFETKMFFFYQGEMLIAKVCSRLNSCLSIVCLNGSCLLEAHILVAYLLTWCSC